MSITYHELISEIETIAPRSLEESWDNCGMQINMGNNSINRILISLEITKEIIEEAKKLDIDFLITHHPLLFHKLDVVDNNTITGNYIVELIKLGISVYSAHTTFDSAFGGNNEYLAELLGLHRVRHFKSRQNYPNEEIMGRLGDLKEPISLEKVVRKVEDALKIQGGVRVIGDVKRLIKKVGICTGAGGDIMESAIRHSCDLFITGDVRHHEALLAKESGLCVIDAGHYWTERIFTENFAEKLKRATGEKVEIFESQINTNPFTCIM